MGNTKKVLLGFVFLLIPVGVFQNCANFITPHHDGSSFDLSSYNEAGYTTTLKPLIRTNCGSCHGINQEPKFAVANDAEAIEALISGGLVSTTTPASSEIVIKISLGHSGLPTTLATELQTAIAAWAAGMITP